MTPINRRISVLAASIPMSLVLLSAALGWPALASDKENRFSPHVDSQGRISLPQDFRNEMVHLGSWPRPTRPIASAAMFRREPRTGSTSRRTRRSHGTNSSRPGGAGDCP